MGLQVAFGDETFAAFLVFADIGSVTGVSPHVSFKITAFVECAHAMTKRAEQMLVIRARPQKSFQKRFANRNTIMRVSTLAPEQLNLIFLLGRPDFLILCKVNIVGIDQEVDSLIDEVILVHDDVALLERCVDEVQCFNILNLISIDARDFNHDIDCFNVSLVFALGFFVGLCLLVLRYFFLLPEKVEVIETNTVLVADVWQRQS